MTTEPGDDGLVPLGAGPVATVFAGVRPATGEAYAIKVFPGPLDRRTRGEVERELARLAVLRGRAPVLVADGVEELPDGRCGLRMELYPQSMPELIASFGPLSVPDALALGITVASALAEAGRAGLVHGSVTPGNVLFRDSGEPVLADFGRVLRRAFPPEPSEWSAPETVRDGSADERSDLYGLGVILYLALTGRSPYAGAPGEPREERVLRVLSAPVPVLDRPGLPAGLADLVGGLLAKDPEARPAGAPEVAERLVALHAAATLPDRTPAPEPPAGPEQAPGPEATIAGRASDSASVGGAAPVVAGGAVWAPRPRGRQILEFTPENRPRRKRPGIWVPAAIAGFALLAVVAVLLLVNRPAELTAPPTPAHAGAPTASGAPTPDRAVQLQLLEVKDRGDHVELAWRSSRALDFGVVVAAEGERAKVEMVQRRTSHRVRVDPVRKYCFQIQGSDGTRVYESSPKPIRGANCLR